MEDHPQIEHQEDHLFTSEDFEPRAFTPPPRRRVFAILGILLVLLLLAVLPPLVHVNRYQKQIAQSISQSLGRPVSTGKVTLTLLPFPGFTIDNFVVSEDPAFGSEPVIHASSVMARLRWRSLWRRRVEFSRITLSDASVNLVRRPDGVWNLESILLQASRMPAAPTGQRGAGDRPRFPYIEASGARLNLKMGLEKLPVSLTEADFALWLPQAEQWRLRLEAHPARTDASVTDTGVLRLEGTLGRAAHLPEVPVDLHASWTAAPLGAASAVVSGRDLGFRGELTFNASLQGTAGNSALQTRLQLDRVRRADFVPASLLDADITCTARALGNLHRLEDLHCAWPTGTSGTGLLVTGSVPDTLTPGTANLQADLHDLPASTLLDALRLATPRVSPSLTLGGTVNAHFTCCEASKTGQWITGGNVTIAQATLANGDGPPYVASTVTGNWSNYQLQFDPMPLDLGAAKPTQFALHMDWTGYAMSLTGPAHRDRLEALAAALPLFGDGLSDSVVGLSDASDLTLNLISDRTVGHAQVWRFPEVLQLLPPPRKRRR